MERTLDSTSAPRDTLTLFRQTWRPLDLLNLYRLVLAGTLLALALIPTDWTRTLGAHNPAAFVSAAAGYLLFAVFSAFTIRGRWPAFPLQLHTQLLADLIAILLLTYASGGVRSGLGLLLIMPIAGGSILVSTRVAALFASLASIGILMEESLRLIDQNLLSQDFTHAGLLGITYFATALIANGLARRAEESEALAEQRGVDLANMEQLTEYVIQRMQTGVIVVDRTGQVRLINESARQLLGRPVISNASPLTQLSPELATQMEAWRAQPLIDNSVFRPTPTSAEILPRFARLGTHTESGTLIFLEDTSATVQQAQQMKLASLGRLTASIAHEIRNPLGAISHAGQLLAESPQLPKADRRLTQIICEQSQRMNTIVENVLQLSRRSRTHPEEFELKPWLTQFVSEFTRSKDIAPEHIELHVEPENIKVRIDPSQLHQVVWNLCENGIRYSLAQCGAPRIALRAGHGSDSRTPFLDVIDWGKGIDATLAAHLFEPFFTTETKGTGLGLYISRELCECNQARLAYLPAPHGGSIFRMTFADPRRRQVA